MIFSKNMTMTNANYDIAECIFITALDVIKSYDLWSLGNCISTEIT